MKVSHIEHLGVAVKSLDEAIPYWENVLGLKCYAIEEVADQKVRTAFFMLGQTKIELLDPPQGRRGHDHRLPAPEIDPGHSDGALRKQKQIGL